MSKIDPLSTITSSYAGIIRINDNMDSIKNAFQNTVSRDGSSPNTMGANLDMDNYQLLNLSTPTLNNNAATKVYVDGLIGTITALVGGQAGTPLDFALARANHTGVQAIDTVTGLQVALDSKAALTSLGSYLTLTAAAIGYQPLAAVLTSTTASFTTAQEAKLAAISAGADATGTANVDAAGAVMNTDFSVSGLLTRTAADTYTGRTLTGTANELTVTNGSGVSDNPTISIPTSVTFTGKTITGGTFSGPTLSGTVAGTPTFSGNLTFSGTPNLLAGVKLSGTSPYVQFQETDAPVDETIWRWAPISGNMYLLAYSDDLLSSSSPIIASRTGTVIDYVQLNATTIDINGATDISTNLNVHGTITNGGLLLTNWTSLNTDIAGIIPGSAFGTLAKGQDSGHYTVGLRENNSSDAFNVVSGGGNYNSDTTYDTLCFSADASGKAYIAGTLDLGHASDTTIARSTAGQVTIEGVQVATASNTLTFTNKTITSPTFSGTIAGTPTVASAWAFSTSPTVPTPTTSTQAANKSYVDSVAVGLQVKSDCAVATTANITLSGEQTIDGVLTAASRVLVKDQTTTANNGIYVSAAGAWARATDMNTWSLTIAALVPVTGGAANGNKVFASTTASGGTLGATTITFANFVVTSGLQPLDSDLTAIAALATTSFGRALLTEASAATIKATLDLETGIDLQAYSAVLAATTASYTIAEQSKLSAIESSADVTDAANVNAAGAVMHADLPTSGLLVQDSSESYVARSIVAPAAGISIANGTGVLGNPTLSLANDLSALEGLASTGIAVRSSADTWVQRTLAGTTNEITATNGDGVSGNPTFSLPAALTFTGKTVTGGTFSAPTISSPTLSGTAPGTLTLSGAITITGGISYGTVGSKLREYNSAETAITGLTGGSTYGSILEGALSGHNVSTVRENDAGDKWWWLSGGGNYNIDTTYDTTAMSLSMLGALATAVSVTSPLVYASSSLELGNASDTTFTRKAAGIAQIETKQLATVGPRVYRTSQYCVGDGSTNDYAAFAALQTTAEADSAIVVVDGWIRLGSNLTVTVPIIVEGGGFYVETAKVLTMNCALAAPRIQIFLGPGTVTYNGQAGLTYPEWWGVKCSQISGSSSSANLSSVNKMHASIAAGSFGAEINWLAKQYAFSGAWTAITSNNIIHLGGGASSKGTWFIFENTTGNDITFQSAQHCMIKHIMFDSTIRKTSGYSIQMNGMFKSRVENCYTVYGYDGVQIYDSTECYVVDYEMRYMLGTRGVLFNGASGSYRLTVNNLTADNPYPTAVIALPRGPWAVSTAYALGAIVVANSKIWQCSTAGTSAGAGSGPSTIPGTVGADAFTATLTDGTAVWKFVAQSDLSWLVQDSYAYSLTCKQLALLNGAYGFRMKDTANTGTSYPIWAYIDNMDTDHPYYGGVYATGGEGLYLDKCWQGSTLYGHGIYVPVTFRGEGTITDSRIYGNANNGILIDAPGFIITSNQIGDNSTVTSAAYHGIVIGSNVNDFVVSNNMCGDLVGVTGNNQGYGIIIPTGTSDHYTLTNNVCRNNVTGGVADGGTGANKTVSGNVT